MNKLILIIALSLLTLPGFAQSRSCLRVMPMADLARNAILIARVKVHRADKANYRGLFSQIATLNTVDVIEGDFTLKEIHVFARSNVQCAEDNYTAGQEMLIFLEPEDSLFHTLNYQYGQFLIVGDVVKGWRDKDNQPLDKPYAEVRKEIEEYINAAHKPPSETVPQQPTQSGKPPVAASQGQ